MGTPVFNTLEGATGDGLALRAVQAGETVASKNGIIGFAFQDSSNNAVLPTLDAAGRIAVTFVTGTCLKDQGTDANGSPEATLVALATITLTATETYKNIEYTVGGRKGGYFIVDHLDDATPDVLDEIFLDSGQYTFRGSQECMEITAGASGTQELRVRAYNWGTGAGKEDTLSASISCLQLP